MAVHWRAPFFVVLCNRVMTAGRQALDAGAPARHVGSMLVYKVLRAPEWAMLREAGEIAGAPIDLADGFVHLSTGGQLAETLALHFTGEEGLELLALETEALGDALKWEPSRGGQDFPHLYEPLRAAQVVWHETLALSDGVHVLPEGVR